MRLKSLIAVLALTALGVASYAATTAAADCPKGLKATISRGKADEVVACYHNGTDKNVRVDKQVIGCGILALDVRDTTGKVIPPVPPPVPAAKTQYVVIAAGTTISISYDMNFFSPPLPAGTYRVQVRLPDWRSNELEYRVGKKK